MNAPPSLDSLIHSSLFPTDTTLDSVHWQAPAPIAYSILEMLHEPLFNSADEMFYLLEVCLRHFGWLWMIEYAHAPFHDPALDRVLFAALFDSQREPSAGVWAYLGSRISHVFRQHAWPLGVQPLQDFVYGDPRDTKSLLSVLLATRNHFAHSSFDTHVQDVVQHRTILWRLLAPMFRLFQQHPVLFWDPEHGVWRRANGHWSQEAGENMPEPVPYRPYIGCSDGSWRSLSPWLQIEKSKDAEWMKRTYTYVHLDYPWLLRYFSIKKSSALEKRRLFAPNLWLVQHLERYEREEQGYLDFEPIWAANSSELSARDEVFPALRQALRRQQKKRPRVVWLEGYPGSGKTAWIAQSSQMFQTFFVVIRYQIRPNHLTLSPLTLLRYILQRLYVHPGMQAWWPEHILPSDTVSQTLHQRSLEELDSCMFHILGKWKEQRKRLLLCVDQFHWAMDLYQEETTSLHDWLCRCRGDVYQNLRILVTGRPGYVEDMIHDEVISLPSHSSVTWGELSGELSGEFGLWLSELGIHPLDFPEPSSLSWDQREQAFRRSILLVLSQSEKPLSLWEIREGLVVLVKKFPTLFSSRYVFTPQIEWNLHDMRSYLRTERFTNPEGTDTIRYDLFSSAWKNWLGRRLRLDLGLEPT